MLLVYYYIITNYICIKGICLIPHYYTQFSDGLLPSYPRFNMTLFSYVLLIKW